MNNGIVCGIKGVMASVGSIGVMASVGKPQLLLTSTTVSHKGIDMVRYMLDMQRDLNNKLSYKAKPNLLKYFLAVTVEAGELIESLGYKWWKDGEVDITNAKIEAIDMLHFILSSYNLYEDNNTLEFNLLVEEWDRINDTKRTLDTSVDSRDLEYTYECVLDLLTIKEFRNYVDLVNSLGMTKDEVFKLYLGKNVLNSFRANNGYKDNTYIKIWNSETKEEDNHIMYAIIQCLELGDIDSVDIFKRNVYNTLESYYTTNVVKQVKETL